MIRIQRDNDEPSALANARSRQIARAAQAYSAYGIRSDEFKKTLAGYNQQSIKEKLYVAQHQKCVWCEQTVRFSSSPVEHYRPKNGAWRHLPGKKQKPTDSEHYWWLTWTWKNLFFSCPTCNDPGHKSNYFPLAKGTRPLQLPKKPLPNPPPPSLFDTSTEQPLLLDPTIDDPMDHIQWIPSFKHLRRERWIWAPKGKTDRGKATVQILKLYELGDFIQDHLKKCVLPSIEEIEKHLGALPKRKKDAQERWDKLLANTLAPESKLSAATWCALEIWMPKKKRKENGLSEPRRPGS
jgi:hypothetical protein